MHINVIWIRQEREIISSDYIKLAESPNIPKGLYIERENYRFKHQTWRRACSSPLRSTIDRPPQFLRDTFPRTMYARMHVYTCVRMCVCALRMCIHVYMCKEDRQHVVRSHELVKRLILTFQHSSSMQLAYFVN